MVGDLAAVSFTCIAPPTPQGALLWRRRGLEPRTAVLLREMFRLTARSRSCITVLPRLHIGRALPPAVGAFHPIRLTMRTGAFLMRRRKTMTRLPNGAWSGGRGSNPRPSDWKSDALPAELPPHISERGRLGSLSLDPRSDNVLHLHFSQFPPKRTILKGIRWYTVFRRRICAPARGAGTILQA